MGIRDRAVLTALGGGHALSLLAASRRFARGAARPRATQEALLRRFLERNAETAYGRAHGYGRIRSVRDFQAAVPIVTYDDLAPWVDRIAAGETRVLTASSVRMLERSSGSAATRKLIPYTAELLDEFSAATAPWMLGFYTHRPALLGTSSYWSVSPAAREAERTSGGLPIGFEDDTEYFGPVTRWALRRMLAVPGTVARIADVEQWRFETAKRLLAAEDLGLISVWNPSFLTLLMRCIERELPQLLRAIDARRAARIDAALGRAGALTGEAIWPRLALLSCWTDGHAAHFVAPMKRFFPRVEVQPKGLLATEGVVSFPIFDEGAPGASVVAVTSHFIEFMRVDAPDERPLLCDELEVGVRYSPILTTGGGFARYHLEDVVTCIGHHEATPLVRFEGKLDRVSDLCGEKLHATEVDRAIATAARECGVAPEFALLAPSRGEPPRYCLYVEADADRDALAAMAGAVERELARGHHYKYCRDLGQLDGVAAVAVEGGLARYEAALVARGARAGDVKPTFLDGRVFWEEVFR